MVTQIPPFRKSTTSMQNNQINLAQATNNSQNQKILDNINYVHKYLIPNNEINPESISLCGQGGFGQVFKVIRQRTIPAGSLAERSEGDQIDLGQDTSSTISYLAFKQHKRALEFDKMIIDDRTKTLKEILSEARIIKKCESPNVIKFEGFWLRKYYESQKLLTLVICLEWAAAGSLHNYFKSCDITNYKLPGAILKKWWSHVTNGLAHLHKMKYIHNDIKSHNVLMCIDRSQIDSNASSTQLLHRLFLSKNEDYEYEIKNLDQDLIILKLADFGAVKQADENGRCKVLKSDKPQENEFGMTLDHQPRVIGTSAWMAPELFEAVDGNSSTFKSDIWSLGVLLWEILTGRMPYRGMEHLAICVKVKYDGSELPIPDTTPECFKEVLKIMCWSKLPENRSNIDDICRKIAATESNISQEYETVNFIEYQDKIQNALELLKAESESIDAQKKKVEFEKKLLNIKEEQLQNEKRYCADFYQQTEIRSQEVKLKEQVISLLTNLAKESEWRPLSERDKKKLKQKIKKGLKNKTLTISKPQNFVKHEGPIDFLLANRISRGNLAYLAGPNGMMNFNIPKLPDSSSEAVSKSSSNSQCGNPIGGASGLASQRRSDSGLLNVVGHHGPSNNYEMNVFSQPPSSGINYNYPGGYGYSSQMNSMNVRQTANPTVGPIRPSQLPISNGATNPIHPTTTTENISDPAFALTHENKQLNFSTHDYNNRLSQRHWNGDPAQSGPMVIRALQNGSQKLDRVMNSPHMPPPLVDNSNIRTNSSDLNFGRSVESYLPSDSSPAGVLHGSSQQNQVGNFLLLGTPPKENQVNQHDSNEILPGLNQIHSSSTPKPASSVYHPNANRPRLRVGTGAVLQDFGDIASRVGAENSNGQSNINLQPGVTVTDFKNINQNQIHNIPESGSYKDMQPQVDFQNLSSTAKMNNYTNLTFRQQSSD